VQRCQRQNFRVKANSGMAGTPEVFIIIQIVAVVFVSWGAVVLSFSF